MDKKAVQKAGCQAGNARSSCTCVWYTTAYSQNCLLKDYWGTAAHAMAPWRRKHQRRLQLALHRAHACLTECSPQRAHRGAIDQHHHRC